MDTNDFLNSFAQENVSFTTQVVRTARVGDNFWKVMVFVENNRFVDSAATGWTLIPGSATIKALSVNATDYAEYTSGVLQSWLYDLFCNGFTGDCILVACAPIATGATVIVYSSDGVTFYEDAELTIPATIPAGKIPTATGTENQYSYVADPTPEEFIEAMEEAYNTLKAYAYHKTVCAAPALPEDTSAFAVDPGVAVKLAQLCAGDKNLLSSAPYFPYCTATPASTETDPLYAALTAVSADAFMSCHADTTRNAALFSLGLAMSTLNGSGTCIGNSMDMSKTLLLTPSSASGVVLSKPVRDVLKSKHIQVWKNIGDNTGAVAAEGAQTLQGDVMQATWILAYITYMTKVRIAQEITNPNFLKNATNYGKLITLMSGYIGMFSSTGSGRLRNVAITAPAFDSVDSSGDAIVIPNAWTARYVDQIRNVQITGTMYIGEE